MIILNELYICVFNVKTFMTRPKIAIQINRSILNNYTIQKHQSFTRILVYIFILFGQ